MTQTWQTPLLKQSTRRWLMIGCYGGYALLILTWVLVASTILKTALLLVFALTCLICVGLLQMPNILGISDGMEQLLDERQRTFRNAMYVWAYRILSVLLVVITFISPATSIKRGGYRTAASSCKLRSGGSGFLWRPCPLRSSRGSSQTR